MSCNYLGLFLTLLAIVLYTLSLVIADYTKDLNIETEEPTIWVVKPIELNNIKQGVELAGSFNKEQFTSPSDSSSDIGNNNIIEEESSTRIEDSDTDNYTPTIKVDMSDKYIGLEDIRKLWDENNSSEDPESPVESNSSESPTKTMETDSTPLTTPSSIDTSVKVIEDSKSDTAFSPFTPNTLEFLKDEISKTSKSIEDITKNLDQRPVSDEDKQNLSNLIDQQKYLIDQHKKHIESSFDLDTRSITTLKDEIKDIVTLEKDCLELKENLIELKDKLEKDLNTSVKDTSTKEDLLSNTRKASDGNWKQGLTQSEINAIEGIEDRLLKDTVKNRIELEALKNKK